MTEQSPAPEAPEPDAPIEPEPSGEVVAFDHDAPSFLQRNRGKWDPGNVAVIRNTVAKGASDAELAMFLELAAYLRLNPLAKEIWCAKSPGRNGEEGRVLIMVGRDGMLRIADRHPAYRGMRADVVHARDEFSVTWGGPGGVEVHHSYDHRKPEDERGAIDGAWAVAYRHDREPSFFYASLAEYLPKSEKKVAYSPWGSQTSAMILKVAQATALKFAFPVSGVAVEGSAEPQLNPGDEPPDDDALFGDDEALTARLRGAMDALDWLPAKRRARLAGLDAEGRAALADELDSLVDTESEGEPADAEVVG